MILDESKPCTSCILRDSSFCSAILDAPLQQQQTAQDRLQQTFGGADAHRQILLRGVPNEDVYILCYGWAVGFVRLPDGRRQILSILLAGDLFSSKLIFEEAPYFGVQSLTDVRFSRINRADLKARLGRNPKALDALAKVCGAEGKAADDLLIDLGRRSADERVARLILSVTERLRSRVVIREERYPFPLRQQDIADVVGLTPVHVSRVITKFRQIGLIELGGGSLTIVDPVGLRRIGLLN